MAKKIISLLLAALCLFVVSCYPELSVQQYDKLKEDLVKLDNERTALAEELAYTSAELEIIKENNKEVRTYIDFMLLLVNTQSTEKQLSGDFDAEALVTAKDQLIEASEKLEDNDIHYYLSLINPENEAQTAGAYYKAIEYCIKNIKQKLGVASKP